MGPSNHEGELRSQHFYLNTFIKYTHLEDAGLKTEHAIFDTIYIIYLIFCTGSLANYFYERQHY